MRSPSRSEGFGAESVLACRLCLIRTGLRRARLWRIPVLERPPRPHSVGGDGPSRGRGQSGEHHRGVTAPRGARFLGARLQRRASDGRSASSAAIGFELALLKR